MSGGGHPDASYVTLVKPTRAAIIRSLEVEERLFDGFTLSVLTSETPVFHEHTEDMFWALEQMQVAFYDLALYGPLTPAGRESQVHAPSNTPDTDKI